LATRYDLIVVGAGINGCAIARDAARRGLHVMLIDRGDIGGGTTAASTRLIHGGLRYLEHLDVRLVREALRERDRLLANAPHQVKPIPFVIPMFSGAARGRRKISIGLRLYQALDRSSTLPVPRMLETAGLLELEPLLSREGLQGGAL
jgi:glycerol-3-phosphate dehydrogenase